MGREIHSSPASVQRPPLLYLPEATTPFSSLWHIFSQYTASLVGQIDNPPDYMIFQQSVLNIEAFFVEQLAQDRVFQIEQGEELTFEKLIALLRTLAFHAPECFCEDDAFHKQLITDKTVSPQSLFAFLAKVTPGASFTSFPSTKQIIIGLFAQSHNSSLTVVRSQQSDACVDVFTPFCLLPLTGDTQVPTRYTVTALSGVELTYRRVAQVGQFTLFGLPEENIWNRDYIITLLCNKLQRILASDNSSMEEIEFLVEALNRFKPGFAFLLLMNRSENLYEAFEEALGIGGRCWAENFIKMCNY